MTMKRSLTFLLFILVFFSAFCQDDVSQPPFKRFPTLPPVKILLSDSSTIFSKAEIPANKPVLYMIFSPECSHCQHETEELIAHKELFKDVQIVMVTMHPLWMMNEFVSKYKVNTLPNVIVGRDIYYTSPGFYNIHNLPFLAMYNKKGELINTFEGSMPVEKVAELLNEGNR